MNSEKENVQSLVLPNEPSTVVSWLPAQRARQVLSALNTDNNPLLKNILDDKVSKIPRACYSSDSEVRGDQHQHQHQCGGAENVSPTADSDTDSNGTNTPVSLGNRTLVQSGHNSRLRPPSVPNIPRPPHPADLTRIKKKYLPVTSSGYGKLHKRSSSTSSLNRLEKNSSDEEGSACGSMCSTASQRSASAKTTLLKKSKSVRTIPAYQSKRRRSNTSNNPIRSEAGSAWAQKQREIQKQRKERKMERLKEITIPTCTKFGVSGVTGQLDGTTSTPNSSSSSSSVSSSMSNNRSQKRSVVPASSSNRTAFNSNNAVDPPSKSAKSHLDSSPNDKSFAELKVTKVEEDGAEFQAKSATPKNQQSGAVVQWKSPHSSKVRTPNSIKNNGTPPMTTPRCFRRELERSRIAASELVGGSFDPNSSEILSFAKSIFCPSSGKHVSDDEIRKLLHQKTSSGTKQWELKKKVESCNSIIKKLKETLANLLECKNSFCSKAVDVELSTKQSLARLLSKLHGLEEDKIHLKKLYKDRNLEINTQKEAHKYLTRDHTILQEKLQVQMKEIADLKELLALSERNYTQASISLAVAEGRLEGATTQADGWRAEIAHVEASKAKEIKDAVNKVSVTTDKEMILLRDECAALRMKMESREEDLGRLVQSVSGLGRGGVSGSNFNGNGNGNGGGSHLDHVKMELDRLRKAISEAESSLALNEAELARALLDSEAAAARAAAKDRDMSELMKGLSDIQSAGQAREEELRLAKKCAEERTLQLERTLSEIHGSLSVLEHEKSTLTVTLGENKHQQEALESTIHELKSELLVLKTSMNEMTTNLQIQSELRARSEMKEKEERNERIACSAQMVAMTKEHTQSEARLKEAAEFLEKSWKEKLCTQEHSYESLTLELNKAKELIMGLEGNISSMKEALNDKKSMVNAKSVEENGRLHGEINVLKERLRSEETRSGQGREASAEIVRNLEAQLQEGHAERRKMHNVIQELRGNVRVFARVRPFLPGDGVDSDTAEPAVTPKNDTSLKISKEKDLEYQFKFDRVFPPSSGQDTIFKEVSEFVQSALDGYNVCLFSYGQTGSGKTHTMQGSGVGQMRGIIPRAIEQVGIYKESLEKEGWSYEMHVSFLEIYNEKIRDLLRNDDQDAQNLKHEIKLDSNGRRFVTDLNKIPLEPTDMNAIENIMQLAAKHRSVASTDMNAVSSRSHSVFTLHLAAVHSEQRQSLRGTLNLVDLAGSERLERSGATGDRAKEAMAINKSLSSLTDVFVSIGKKASHVPFRNSKLTYLLQPSLSGDGKTLMMVNLSPTEASFQESLCTLRFASQVNKCELGKPRRSIEEVDATSVDNNNNGTANARERSKHGKRTRVK